jgi:fructosamine-3-kinase
MSNMSRYEWHDQYASLSECMKGFLKNPDDEQLEAVLAEMRSYAAAAKSGCIEIPQHWTSYN